MTTRELQGDLADATSVAKVRSTSTGEVTLAPGGGDACAYGPVEIAWYPDRLKITAVGAGPASITEDLSGESQDVVIEIRPASLDELLETMPGAD